MEVLVNGTLLEISEGTTIAGFIAQKGLQPNTVVVEYNGNILSQAMWETIVLTAHDKLEIVTFVGGG